MSQESKGSPTVVMDAKGDYRFKRRVWSKELS